ncbi:MULTISPECIES: hypothetical protein [unclassified Sphingomonas]|uniref:hypothetical protein n=1 Tax=unclassified Sphingomonas TaxID=196159 RepID=UPI0006FB87F9|nr:MULTISPECIES: hypothetical protein [unclassified Sphingomonas]KQX26335.1 hypothetical protein ASD17_00175 [Sphingomonas sp. Root1294]KQY69406.1 hypothetical protein ASD39_01370 [Sphingomonas sp. Root50]KRB89816.1 hypothetical protein ASE22_16285 [Sphingomonas sp. Root720]
MRRSLLIGLMLLALPACEKKDAPAVEEDGGGPQIATSIDDAALPVDRSDQVTAIDATTGDSGGMPKDGGAVVRTAAKPDPRPADAPSAQAVTIPTPAPVVALPPPVVTPPPPPPPPAAQ